MISDLPVTGRSVFLCQFFMLKSYDFINQIAKFAEYTPLRPSAGGLAVTEVDGSRRKGCFGKLG